MKSSEFAQLIPAFGLATLCRDQTQGMAAKNPSPFVIHADGQPADDTPLFKRGQLQPDIVSAKRSETGQLWHDIHRLCAAGIRTGALEYYTEDLEHSLRRSDQGKAAAQHALNNLEHEAQSLLLSSAQNLP